MSSDFSYFTPPPATTDPRERIKNQKRDVRRKEGTVAKPVLTGTPPISGASTVPTSPLPANAPAPTPPFNGSAPSAIPGLIKPGNIDIHARPIVWNADGSYSTVRSITVTDDQGHAILIPTVVGNKVVSNQEAIQHYKQTGQNLGIFASEQAADAYAQSLHNEQAQEYGARAASQGIVPPPPANGAPSTTDKIPQMSAPTAPIPQYTPPVFHQPQYEPPKKGLEYLALALGLLFPGAPISRIAAGFAGGLGQGAQMKYQRSEQQAENQYKNDAAAAQATYANQQAAYNADVANQQRQFENQKVTYAAAQAARARGIDPATGQPFTPPPALQSVLPPGVHRQPTAADYARHEAALAQFYEQQGATALSTQHMEAAKEYAAEQKQQDADASKLSLAIFNQSQIDKRTQYVQGQQNARTAFIQNRQDSRSAYVQGEENARQAIRMAHEDAVRVRSDPTKLNTLRDESMRVGKEFYSDWTKAITPPTDTHGVVRTGPDGKTPLPARIDPQMQQTLTRAFVRIDRDSDPDGMAKHYADALTDPVAKQLLLARGRAADLSRRAKGLPILPHAFAPIEKKPKLDIGAEVSKLKAAGIDPASPQAMAAMKADGFDEATIRKAVGGKPVPDIPFTSGLGF